MRNKRRILNKVKQDWLWRQRIAQLLKEMEALD